MKRRGKILLLVLGILVLAVAGWFAYGLYESNRFDERLAAMYADGSLQTFAQLQGEPISDSENGWTLLQEADELASEIERRISDELLEAGTRELRYTPDRREDWTPAQVEHEKRVLRELALVFAKLDEALQRPTFVHLGDPPLDSHAFMPFLTHFQRLLRRVRIEPQRYGDEVDRMFCLLDRWDVREGGDASIRTVLWRTLVLRGVREGIEGGHVDTARREVWDGMLRREEARALHGMELSAAWNRAVLIWLVQAWRRGEDPLAAMRSRIAAVWDVLPDDLVEPDAEGDAVDQLGDLVQRAQSMGAPPWYAAWYGRPLLEHRAHALLDALLAEPLEPVTLEGIKRDASAEDETEAHGARSLLHTVAALRLARVALAVHGAIEHGMGSPFDLRVGVAARLGGQHLRDALGDELFVLEVRGKHVVIHPRPSAALNALNEEYATLEGEAREALLHEDLLLWRVPVP